MKVELSTTKLNLTPQRASVLKANSASLKNSEPLGPIVRISFKGNSGKNYRQVISYAAEDKGLGIKEYDCGGEAAVVQQAPDSWVKHQNMDARNALPYYCYDNPEGKIKVLTIEYDQSGKRINAVDPSKFKTVDLDYVLQPGEQFVMQSAPSNGKSKFLELRATDVKGTVERISETDLSEIKTVPYRLFDIVGLPEGTATRYLLHTPDLAKLPKAYGGGGGYGAYGAYGTGGTYGTYGSGGTYGAYGAYGGGGSTHLAYADSNRAFMHMLPQMNTEKMGNFNPANIWGHDRTSFVLLNEASTLSASGNSYFNGLRAHGTFHNNGPVYQGTMENPFEFLRLVCSKEDLEALKKHPEFEFLKSADKAIREGKLNAEDLAKAKRILEPLLGGFIDDNGKYNISMIPIRGTQVNPFNMTQGGVSRFFGFEMQNHNFRDVAGGLTSKLASVKSINITNVCTPANMKLDDPEAGFGRGNNGLTANKAGFTTFKPIIKDGTVENIDEILAAKKSNTKWLLDLIGNADTTQDPEALQKLFFDNETIHPPKGTRPSTILGQLSKYDEGDKILMGWGRPDPQKGFPTTFEAFLKFLKDPSVPEQTKLHTKLLVGAGADTWEENARDFLNIQKFLKEIQELDGGKYKGNAMYVNGLFPNRLVACAYNSDFTSVFEPCGLTPAESSIAGTPSVSIRTGGAPDLIVHYDTAKGLVTNETGILTKGPYLRNPEDIGLTSETLKDVKPENMFATIDDKRRAVSSDEVCDAIKKLLSLDEKDYRQMTINNFLMENDWHNNKVANGGQSANTRYMREVWNIDEKTLTPLPGYERNTKPLKRLVGQFAENIETLTDKGKQQIDTVVKKAKFSGKQIAAAVAVGVAVIGGIAYYLNKNKTKTNSAIASTSINQQSTNTTTQTAFQFPFAQPKAFSKIA